MSPNLITKLWHSTLGLFLSLAVTAGAHVGDRVYPIAWLSDEMLEKVDFEDGSVDEWYELVGEPTMTLLDFADQWGQREPGPSDLDFRIWLAWHDEPARFYVAFVASDDVYKNTHDYSGDWSNLQDDIQLNDGILVAIDGDHSGGAGCSTNCSEEDWLEIRGQTQYYEAIARTVGGPILDDIGTRYRTGTFPWTVLPPYGDSGGGVAGESPAFSAIELYVTPFDFWGGTWDSPGDKVVSDLTAGQVIGLAVMVYDNDEPVESSEEGVFWVLEGIQSDGLPALFDIMNHRGDRFIDGLLLPAEPEKGSAVESVSWGRIKAALGVD